MTSVADAIAALKDGDAAALAQVMAQRKLQGRKPGGNSKRKVKGKKKKAAEDEEGQEDVGGDTEAAETLTQVDEEVRSLPREKMDTFYPAAVQLVAPSEDESEEAERLKAREAIAEFTVVLVETKGASIDKEELFAVAQELHDQLLRLRGDTKQPTFFRSPDAVPFLSFLFTLHVPFVDDINETIRNQIPNQRNSILVKYGSIYFKAWVGSKGAFRTKIEEECIQRYIRDAVHAGSTSLFNAVRTVLQIFFENKRHPGVDEMLYRICSPILWRGVKAPNDSVRRQATILLFDNFPLRDPQFNNEMMDVTLQKQFDTFEELLGDSHPALRVAAIEGVSKVLSVYWELLPAETIRCFISKLVVDLVNDASSSSVRAAVFEGIQFILDNHNSHSILKPLLPMLAPLINDRNEKVRAEFGALLVRIKSIRNLHFYDVVPVNDLLCRMVMDRDSPLACKQLVSLFLNSYFPQSVGGSSQVARCLALVMGDSRYSECKTFLREQLNVESLEALLLAYSEDRPYDQEALSSIWRIVGYLGDLSEGVLLDRLVENLMKMNESSSKKLMVSMVDCLAQWKRLPFLARKLAKYLEQWRKNKFRTETAASKSKKSKKSEVVLNPVVVLGTIEYLVQLPTVKGLNAMLRPISVVLESCVEPMLEFDTDDVEEVYKANSFGFIRLLEVYAKVSVMAECAHVSDETSLLVEKSAKRLSKKDDLHDLQPSEFFTPPKPLSALFAWVARLLLDFRKEIEVTEQATHGKKRRRGKNADVEQLSPQNQMLSRWRNLFSLISLLCAESVAFALERTHWLENGPAADFVSAYVDALCDTLNDMEHFERVVFYQTEHTLTSVHEKYEDKCQDLWSAVTFLGSYSLDSASSYTNAALSSGAMYRTFPTGRAVIVPLHGVANPKSVI
ncbi:hypothetical protein BBO99_00000314 [Phytophthora kernoviae]|uniref:Uncharacterized protein n=1 Tax=Phytophthora kernoviae TaxID=325452 RepID=A0A421H3L6_9STRA|nr:hypothetical protein JM16_000072 [Phytophthora kernoviae]KAG2533608.1 hypothetical protein JM18_000074 [Phytophthora kernoviae]RLN86048.1 hypothetical protein BBO99_00000314 [Phytophthora kernoviae]